MTTKTEFINKWKCWWMLQKQGAELTDAFEKELTAIIKQEVASKNLVKADVMLSLPKLADKLSKAVIEHFSSRLREDVMVRPDLNEIVGIAFDVRKCLKGNGA